MILALIASAALAGQVHYQELSLDELVRTSDAILLVRVADPAWTNERVPVSESVDCGEYPLSWYHFHVKEVLKGAAVDAPTGKIAVAGPHAAAMLDLSRLACLEGTRKSPIHGRYDTDASVKAGRDIIVFLDRSDAWGWQISASDAWEQAKREKKVRKAIRRST